MTSDPKTTIVKPCWWKAILANPYITGSIKFILPFAIATALFTALYLIEPYQQFRTLWLAALLLPPAEGVVIPIASDGVPWRLITIVIFLIDVASALFMSGTLI